MTSPVLAAPAGPYVVPAPVGDPLTGLSAVRLAAMVRAGEVSAVEVARAHLDRVAEVEGRTRALVHVAADDVLAQAAALDTRRAAGERVGPLAGLPVVVKDNIDVAGQVSGCA